MGHLKIGRNRVPDNLEKLKKGIMWESLLVLATASLLWGNEIVDRSLFNIEVAEYAPKGQEASYANQEFVLFGKLDDAFNVALNEAVFS